ncbi:MAG: glutaredoxin family protein [Deltaproteobacteria bacterium]|nr:glutaredoxin family protein [Deltaproteobacteria bacterium]
MAALVVVLGVALGVRSLVSSPPPTPPVLAVSEPPAPPATERRTRTEPPARERVRSGTSNTREPPPHEPAPEAPTGAPSEPDRYAMQSARRRVSITMYSASWCPTCRSAEAYLREHQIRFTKRDIEDGERNSERLRDLNPAGTIPTFELDERVVVGFGPQSFEAALDEAALARVVRR